MSGCEEFAETLNAVLDGDAPASALAGEHVRDCRECRELAAAAKLLAAAGPALRATPAVPGELTKRLVRVRRRRLAPVIAGYLVAGGLIVVGWAESSRPTSETVADRGPPKASAHPTPGRFDDQLATVATVARSASERAVAPTRLLTTPSLSLPTTPQPPTDVLATLGTASKTAAEPVAGPARRAVGLFLRDLRLTAKPAG